MVLGIMLLHPLFQAESASNTTDWELVLTAIMAFAIVVALGISAYSAHIARSSLKDSHRMSRYTYLANKWYDIKEKEFENPDFINIDKTKSYKTTFQGNTLNKYITFAWICWAHAEDIYLNKFHDDLGFQPSLKRYKSLHYVWLRESENSSRFDPEFIKYIEELK